VSTRPAVHLILPLAMTLLLSAPESRAELAVWNQAEVTALAKELETATHALYEIFIKKPAPSVGSTQSQAYYRLEQEVRVLRVIARDDAAKTFTTQDVGERAAAVRGVLNQLGPYYDPDFQTLAPHPNLEPSPNR
jgi:hypothetical protein